jgi:hypothetical protein
VGMAMVDRNRRFLRVNQHFAALADHSMDVLIGRTLQDTIPALAERMVAPVAISPRNVKESFGTKLIKNAFTHDLQGTCEYRLATGGLNCTLSMRFQG